MPFRGILLAAATGFTAAFAFSPSELIAQQAAPTASAPATQTKEDVRRLITAWNDEWAAARLAGDSAKLERMIPASYSAVYNGEPMSRSDFIAGVTQPPAGVALRRFDPLVLTVHRSGEDWVAVVEEKLEIDRTGADGAVTRTYHLWVIRDTWTMENGELVLRLGEVVSNEGWRDGTRPPFSDWTD